MFKTNFSCELYMQMNIPSKRKIAIVKFRTASYVLVIEIGRYQNIPIEKGINKLCTYNVECDFRVHLELLSIPRVNLMDFFDGK